MISLKFLNSIDSTKYELLCKQNLINDLVLYVIFFTLFLLAGRAGFVILLHSLVLGIYFVASLFRRIKYCQSIYFYCFYTNIHLKRKTTWQMQKLFFSSAFFFDDMWLLMKVMQYFHLYFWLWHQFPHLPDNEKSNL